MRGVTCGECGGAIEFNRSRTSVTVFCSPKCRYKARDRARYAADPEGARAKARAYYWANRERVLEKRAAARGRLRPVVLAWCSECGGALEGQQRLVCSRRCKDRRYARLHPEAVAEKQRRKRARRRARAGGVS